MLYDNFNCWDEGCLVGPVSKEVIAQMRKSNWKSVPENTGKKRKIAVTEEQR